VSATAATISARARRRRRLARRFRRHRAAVFGLVVSTIVIAAALLAPLIAPYSPSAEHFDATLQRPGGPFLLGTDDLGRDVFSRIIWGARASIQAGVLSSLLAVAVATPLGFMAGYYRGWVDPVLSRINDVLLAFPFLVLAVGLAAIFGPSLLNATLALGITQIPIMMRIARGEVLALREEDYVEAAVANGAGDATIMIRHILPNALGALIVQATVTVPMAIIGESVLSFLGLGVQPPTPSWGVMLSAGQSFIAQAPWLTLFPGLAIFLTTLSLNLLGDGLRDVLDPRMQA
jgi:peptide/nickel transport system permease protein